MAPSVYKYAFKNRCTWKMRWKLQEICNLQDSCVDLIIILKFSLNKYVVKCALASYRSDKGLLVGPFARERNSGSVEVNWLIASGNKIFTMDCCMKLVGGHTHTRTHAHTLARAHTHTHTHRRTEAQTARPRQQLSFFKNDLENFRLIMNPRQAVCRCSKMAWSMVRKSGISCSWRLIQAHLKKL
jgi:hypothetical protein